VSGLFEDSSSQLHLMFSFFRKASYLKYIAMMGNQVAATQAVTTPPEKLLHFVLKTPLAPPLEEPIRKFVW
jgi:hypothetical protein